MKEKFNSLEDMMRTIFQGIRNIGYESNFHMKDAPAIVSSKKARIVPPSKIFLYFPVKSHQETTSLIAKEYGENSYSIQKFILRTTDRRAGIEFFVPETRKTDQKNKNRTLREVFEFFHSFEEQAQEEKEYTLTGESQDLYEGEIYYKNHPDYAECNR